MAPIKKDPANEKLVEKETPAKTLEAVSVRVLGEFPLSCPLSGRTMMPGQISEGVPKTSWLEAQEEAGLLAILG